MKRIILACALLTLLFCGCGEKAGQSDIITADNFQLDTLITITLYGYGDEAVFNDAFDEIERLEGLLSRARPGSDPDKLAKDAGGSFVSVSAETIFLLEESRKYSLLSGGLFDVTIGPLASLWNIRGGSGHYPSKGELDAAMALVNFRDIITDGSEAMLKAGGMEIDFGAIAKGYIADEVKALLIRKGVKSGVINLGGDVVLIGGKPGGENFRIGVQDPLGAAGEYIGVVEIAEKSLATSGNYERFFMHEGKRYHHIIDPKTGFPADNGLIQVTVITNDAVTGDALSTSAFLLGLEKGMELINNTEGASAIFVTSDKKVRLSEGFSDLFHLTNKDYLFLQQPGATVKVISGRDTSGIYKLSEDREIIINTGAGKNVVVISGGFVRMSEANCPNGDCTSHKAINKTGQQIVCLPNKVLIRIEGE